MSKSYLYAFGVPASDAPVKVGISADPAARVNTIRRNSGTALIEVLTQYAFIDKGHARCAEAHCHAALAAFHTHGEFFKHPAGPQECVSTIGFTLLRAGFVLDAGLWRKADGNLKTDHLERPLCKEARARCADPVYRKLLSQRLREYYTDPEHRRERSELCRRVFADPAVKKRRSEAQKKARNDPAYKANLAEAMRQRYRDPEQRRRQSEKLHEACARPEVKKHKSEAMRKSWANGSRKRKRFKRSSSPNQGRLFE